jgi:hypothetical protein
MAMPHVDAEAPPPKTRLPSPALVALTQGRHGGWHERAYAKTAACQWCKVGPCVLTTLRSTGYTVKELGSELLKRHEKTTQLWLP